jgi:hypothetical protein
MPYRYANMQERIRANVKLVKMSDWDGQSCWIWQGAQNSQGYGKIGMRWKKGPRKGKVRSALAHRMSLIAFKPNRVLTTKSVARHLCNVKLCVNPAHLRGGTQRQNVRDSIKAGSHKTPYRRSKGERYTAKRAT